MGVPQVPEGWRDADNAGLEGWTADTVRIKNSSHGSGGDGDGGDDDDDGSFRSVTKGTQGQHSPEVGHMAKVISATTFSKGASGGGASTTRELEPLPGVKEDKSDDVQSIDDSRRFPLPIEDQSVLPCRPTDAVDKGVVSQSGSGDKIEEREVSTGRSPSGVGRRGSGSKQHASGGASGRGLNDMLCLGFAVVTCLNMGSVTARQKGFFAAEVVCSSPGAETVLRDLGVWVGWRRAVANANTPMSFDLEELSLAGAAMGYMTVIGHALDIVVNAAGVMLLLHARRKPVEQRMSDAVKRVCWASLMMAVWLCGMTMIGFLVTVKGPVGSAAIDFYSQRNLSCEEEVSVSIDYGYAMTTLACLCQVFIGMVALPKPSRWCPLFYKAHEDPSADAKPGNLAAAVNPTSEDLESRAVEGERNGQSPSRPLSFTGSSNGSTSRSRRISRSSEPSRRPSGSVETNRLSWRRGGDEIFPGGGLDPSMIREAICDPV